MLIIETIKQRRNSLKVTQEMLSDLSGVAIGVIKKFESGQGNPTLATLRKLCDALGLEVTLGIKRMVNNEES